MSRKLLSLAALVAVFTVVLGTTDAEARRCCRNQTRNQGCCQNGNFGYANQGCRTGGYANCGFQQTANCGYQQAANYGCQQTPQVTMNAACAPRTTCCVAQPACAVSVMPANYSAPQPGVQQLAPAPAPNY